MWGRKACARVWRQRSVARVHLSLRPLLAPHLARAVALLRAKPVQFGAPPLAVARTGEATAAVVVSETFAAAVGGGGAAAAAAVAAAAAAALRSDCGATTRAALPKDIRRRAVARRRRR